MKIIKNKCYPLFIFTLFLWGCFGQKKAAEAFKIKDNEAFKQYLTAHNIAFKTLSDTIFNKYYGDFLAYEKKVKLEANPYLKVNKVYVHQVNSTAVEFIVYSDNEICYMYGFDLLMDNKVLSKPNNQKVKVLQPIFLTFSGTFQIENNNIIANVAQKNRRGEFFSYLRGIIEKDTITYKDGYISKSMNQFKQKWTNKTRKTNIKVIYKPNLNAEFFRDKDGLSFYKVTGEFDLDSPVQPDIKFEK